MPDIDEKIAKTEEEIRQLKNKKKKLLGEKKAAERKARTHRLIERGRASSFGNTDLLFVTFLSCRLNPSMVLVV